MQELPDYLKDDVEIQRMLNVGNTLSKIKVHDKSTLNEDMKKGNIPREIYVPYQTTMERAAYDNFETLPLMEQLIMTILSVKVREKAAKRKEYKHLVDTMTNVIINHKNGLEVYLTPLHMLPDASHCFRALELLKVFSAPIDLNGKKAYLMAELPTEVKRQFLYPSLIIPELGGLLGTVKKRKRPIYITDDFKLAFPDLIDGLEKASEVREFLESVKQSDGSYKISNAVSITLY